MIINSISENPAALQRFDHRRILDRARNCKRRNEKQFLFSCSSSSSPDLLLSLMNFTNVVGGDVVVAGSNTVVVSNYEGGEMVRKWS